MTKQIIVTPGGERLVMLPESEFQALVDFAEDRIDAEAALLIRDRILNGREETVPADVVNRIRSGENRIRVWREHRQMSRDALSTDAGLPRDRLLRIEQDQDEATLAEMRCLAAVLRIDLEDMVS